MLAPGASAALTLSASSAVTPVRAADQLYIEFTVANTDAFSRSAVVVEMLFPANLNQVFENDFDGDCPGTSCTAGELVTWTLGTIAAGAAVTIELPAIVSNVAANGTVMSFAATVTDSLADTDSANVDVTVQTDVKYDLVLADNTDPATAGAEVTYKLSWVYRQDVPAVTNSALEFTLPAGATFVSATGGGSESGGVVSWALGFLSPGAGGSREVTVQLDNGLAVADVVAANASILSVATPTDFAMAQANTVIGAGDGLQLALESNTDPSRPSEVFNWLLTVTNLDPFTRFGVTVTGPFAQDLNQQFEIDFDGDCGSTTCTASERITWTLGDIPAGGSVTTHIVPTISNVAPGGTLITLPLTARDAAGLQTRQSDTVRVQSDAIYDVALAENSDPALAGSQLTYTLSFGYRADAAAVSNSMLRMPIPAGTTFVSATDGGAVNGGAVEWPLGFLAPADSGVREVVLQLGGGLAAGTVIEAYAQVFAVDAPDQAARSEANTVIAAASGLQLAVESNPNPARLSELTNLQLAVTNTDGFARFGVEVIGIFPQDLLQLFETVFDGNCGSTTCTQGERVTWTVGQIDANETIVLPYPPTLSNIATSGELINFYMAAQDDQGVQTRQLDTLRVQSDAIYDLSLTENSDPAAPGALLTYRLAYGYRADAAAVNQSVLRLPVPVGTTFVSATGGGALVNGAVEWSLGFLSPGQGGERTTTVMINGGLPLSTVLEATAQIASISAPLEAARAQAHTAIAAAAPLQLAIEANPEPVRPSEMVNHQITVSNNDAFTRFGVTLTGYYPQDLNQLFELQFTGDCGSTTCTVGERITWMLGDIPGGTSRTVNMPPVIAVNALDGVLINLFAAATDDQGAQTHQLSTMRVQDDVPYDLALADSADPTTPGATLNYTLTFGYRDDAAAVNDSALRLTLPAGVSLLSTTGGGVLTGNSVDWALGFLSPGDSGVRTATVLVDGALDPATVLQAQAAVYSVNTPDERAAAEADTSVQATVPLSLDLHPTVYAAVENRRLPVQLTVTNNDGFTRFGVALQARFPQNVLQLFESDPEFFGDCASTTCTAGETVSWPLMDMAAGESVTVLLPPTAAAPVVDGRLINFYAWVEDDQGAQARNSQSVISGCIEALDADCDGILDSGDNCLGLANTDQRDTDGDGIGNRCDADIAQQNCQVNAVDLGVFRAAFFGTPASPNWNPDADFNGDNAVNSIDLGIIRSLFFMVPGPSALPNPCSP